MRSSSAFQHHRSRDRVRILGEVFTPERFVGEMLDLPESKCWADETIVFFEPACGSGNFAAEIFERRARALHNKAIRAGIRKPTHFAIANAINTLWAVDIDRSNVDECRGRIFMLALSFLADHYGPSRRGSALDDREFLAHLICAIEWHIQENEALSCLATANSSEEAAEKTDVGKRWRRINGHHQLDFQATWCHHALSVLGKGAVPIELTRARALIDRMQTSKAKPDRHQFHFAVEGLLALRDGRPQPKKSA